MSVLPYRSIPELLSLIPEPNCLACIRLFENEFTRFTSAWGASSKHQAWPGGYLDHVCEVMNIAVLLHGPLAAVGRAPFKLESALLVLYLHDLEKAWKYETARDGSLIIHSGFTAKDERHQFRLKIIEEYGIRLTAAQMNAFTYVEGEGDAYDPHHRVMNELAGFCHVCDTLSARTAHDFPNIENDPWGTPSVSGRKK